MEQRDAASETPSDSVGADSVGADSVDEGPPPSVVERHFWAFLVGGVLLAAGGSAAGVYLQYSQVDRALRSVPYVKDAAQWDGSVPYANRVARLLPYVDASADSTGETREYGSFTRMQGLVVNPAGSAGERYLAVSLAFEAESSSVVQEIQRKNVVIRDAVLALLSEQTVDELADPDRRDALKRRLRARANTILGTGTVDRLYFTEFVLQ